MPVTVSLLYAPTGADPDEVFDRNVVSVMTYSGGTLTIEPTDPTDPPYEPDDPEAWKAAVAATLEAHPVRARRLEGLGDGDIHLFDDEFDIGYVVHDSGVEVYLRGLGGEDAFAALWRALRAVGRRHSCHAFFFDESMQLDLTLRARDARRRYMLL